MTETETENISTVRAYLAALQRGEAGDALRRFFTEDAQQIELPNLLNRRGQVSDLEHMLERSRQGLKLLRSQQYEIVSAIVEGNDIAVEARWTGVLDITLGTLAPGSEMKASLAIFFQFRNGRIATQRNYDCFEPW